MATAKKRRRRRKTRTVKTPNNMMQSRFNSLRADFDALQQDVRGLATDVGDAATEQVQGAMDRVTEWSSENLNGVRIAVKTQPLAACMLSMSAGALIGAWLLR
jgi:outer membrane murein-binding lipoprotein Lpp